MFVLSLQVCAALSFCGWRGAVLSPPVGACKSGRPSWRVPAAVGAGWPRARRMQMRTAPPRKAAARACHSRAGCRPQRSTGRRRRKSSARKMRRRRPQKSSVSSAGRRNSLRWTSKSGPSPMSPAPDKYWRRAANLLRPVSCSIHCFSAAAAAVAAANKVQVARQLLGAKRAEAAQETTRQARAVVGLLVCRQRRRRRRRRRRGQLEKPPGGCK